MNTTTNPAPRSASAVPTFTEIVVRLDDEGLESVVATLRPFGPAVAAAARCGGLAQAAGDGLEDETTSDVMWLRAYCAVRGALSRLPDRLDLVA